ncbi:MAG: hypothetical protein K5770_16495 [Lachnospiraceae bacterium]|nr:hypothetical protein [Lachnospiraceae bacterium]
MLIFDTHIHCLPGIDDGAESMSDAVEMLKIGREQGIGAYICTPHSEFITDSAVSQYEHNALTELKSRTGEELLFGTEIHCTKSNLEDVRRKLGILYHPLGNQDSTPHYYMLEFSYHESPDNMIDIVRDIIREDDVRVILAHAERYVYIKPVMKELRKLGCLVQINISSLTDDIFIGSMEDTIFFLENHYVDFIGTDAHRSTWRPPMVREGLKVLREIVSKEEMNRICYQNAIDLLLKGSDNRLEARFRESDD